MVFDQASERCFAALVHEAPEQFLSLSVISTSYP